MQNSKGIPYKNIINKKHLLVEQQVFRLLYNDQIVIIFCSGWDNYHVIIEDGIQQTAQHNIMTDKEILDTFGIDMNTIIETC